MNDELSYEDIEAFQKLFTTKSLSRDEAVLMLKSYLDTQITCLREENRRLSDDDYRKDRESFRKRKGALLNRMVYCDYRKALKWADSDNTELEKRLEQNANSYNGADSGSIIMDIRKRYNGHTIDSDLYAVRLLLKILESRPDDYPVSEGLVRKMLN